MTELPKPLKRSPNFYERIRAHVERVGGIDLELPPRELGRDPPDFDTADYDQPPPLSAGTDENQQNGPDNENTMKHTDFRIGETFWCSGHRWRCTDVGTRVIVAIRLDEVKVASVPPSAERTLNHAGAEAEGWFNGPPYAAAESVFDEYDIQGCSPEAPTDVNLLSSEPESAASDDEWFGPLRQAQRIT